MTDPDLRAQVDQHMNRGEFYEAVVLLRDQLTTVTQERDGRIEPLKQSDDPEEAEAVRITLDYVLMTRAAADQERELWRTRVGSALAIAAQREEADSSALIEDLTRFRRRATMYEGTSTALTGSVRCRDADAVAWEDIIAAIDARSRAHREEPQPPCPNCGCEARSGAGYLLCECPAGREEPPHVP